MWLFVFSSFDNLTIKFKIPHLKQCFVIICQFFLSFNIRMLKSYLIYDPPLKNILTHCMWHVKENVKSNDFLFSSRYLENWLIILNLLCWSAGQIQTISQFWVSQRWSKQKANFNLDTTNYLDGWKKKSHNFKTPCNIFLKGLVLVLCFTLLNASMFDLLLKQVDWSLLYCCCHNSTINSFSLSCSSGHSN